MAFTIIDTAVIWRQLSGRIGETISVTCWAETLVDWREIGQCFRIGRDGCRSSFRFVLMVIGARTGAIRQFDGGVESRIPGRLLMLHLQRLDSEDALKRVAGMWHIV